MGAALDIIALLPSGISPTVAVALVAVSLFASLITAAMGLGGGTLMLSVLTLVFPAAIVVPFHGAIQLGSNSGRALVQRAFIQWRLALWISLGAVLGSVLGVRFAAYLPESVFKLLIGGFILVVIWLPKPDIRTRGPVSSFVGGTVISFLGMIVGITGPLVLTFIRGLSDRRELVATHAALMTFQNSAKVVAFIFVGFAFAEFLPLILVMVAAGFVGTVLGSKLLIKLPEKTFCYGFKIIITVLALDLIRRAIFG